jgi:predicted nucleic acid-binding protein
MTGPVFVDTNVLIYARDPAAAGRHARARAWLEALWRRRLGRLSYQVLAEYYVTATRRLKPPLPVEVARADVRNLLVWRPVGQDAELLESAWAVQDRFGLSWWDALIVAAARRAGCTLLLSEDLNPGQDYGGVMVVSPFEAEPDEILPDRPDR